MFGYASRLISVLLAAVVVFAVGCAQQIGDIDRTGPNRIEKSALSGEWYYQQTVVGVNATAITSFIGLEGQTERILWEWEEDYLVAYRTHEDVFGIDQTELLDEGEVFDRGRPVAAFSTSHFDVQRSYSSSTGEQTNVIVENSSDRNWYEQEWARVDWTSNNINSGSDYLIDIVDVSDISIAPQNEGGEPSWFIERDENGDVVYIDILNTYIIEPDYTECALEFGIPTWGANCGPETIEVRTSIVKLTEESDYIPFEYDDFQMNDFGWFQTHRPTYNEFYGPRDSGRIYLANRQDIWENSRDANGDELPYAQRTPRPIVYYLSPNFPDELKQTMFDIGEDYDSAFRRIVAVYQGEDIPIDPAEMVTVSHDTIPRMFYVCENPGGTDGEWEVSNEGYRNGICQRPGETKNLGDIRFSMLNWINHPQMDGPLGYGPSTLDVTTGEILSGRANIYGASINTYSQYALDLSKIISGDIDIEDYAYGRTVQDYFADWRAENDDDLFYGLVEERAARAERVERAVEMQLQEPRVRAILDRSPDELRLRSAGEVHPLRLLRGTRLEQLALFPEVQDRIVSLERNPFDAPMEDLIDTLSISRLGDPVSMAADFDSRLDRYFRHGPDGDCVMMGEVLDPSLVGIASELADERATLLADGMSQAEVDLYQWDKIRNRLLRFVMAHEIGHTFGMMHNFAGSFDAMNYHDEYWDLRELTFNTCDENAITFAHDGLFSGHVAPPLCEGGETVAEYNQRSADVMQQLLEGNLSSYQFSTVMDYTPRYYNNAPGLGHYDFAALAYVYGELRTVFNSEPHQIKVEVFYDHEDDDFMSSNVSRSANRILTFDDVDEYLISRRDQTPTDTPFLTDEERDLGLEHSWRYYHYSTIPIMFNGDIEAIYDRALVPESEVGERVLVPFHNCSDYYRGSRTECNVFDSGADFLEIYQDILDSWDGYYYMRFFRRDRAGFGLWLYPVIQSAYNYTMLPMTRLYQHWLIRASGRGTAWYASEWGGDDATTAAFSAIDFLGNVVTKPTIGTYYFDEEENMFLNLDDELDYRAPFYFEIEENIDPASDYLNVGADVGRYGFEQYRRNDDEELGHWGFVEPEILSWFWAKWAAMMALVVPTVEIIGQDTSSDNTAFSIPIYLIFPEELTAFFGALPREDFNVLSSCAVMDGDGKVDSIVQRNLINPAPLACDDENAQQLNPYTSVYGHSDFNMRLLSILYGSAYFQSNYDMSWFDLSNVYIYGRGYTPEPAEGFVFETFEDDNGLIYSAMIPEVIDEDTDENIYVGAQLVRRAQELHDAREAELEASGEQTSEYWTFEGDLGNLLESMRLLNQANEIFEGYNVFLPLTL